MKRLLPLGLLAVTFLSITAWSGFAVPQSEQEQKQLRPFMQQKLQHSKAILEALALEDFDQLAQSAQALSLLSLESNWNRLTTDEYIQQSGDFRRACRVIQEAAHEKNVDRAALGFVDLTVRCVECHKYLRKSGTPSIQPVETSTGQSR